MNSRKGTSKKRKHSPVSLITSRIGKRLNELRHRHRNLWDDDDEEDEDDPVMNHRSSQSRRYRKVRIAQSESEEESHNPSISKNPNCLICSILSGLTKDNCCQEHLSKLNHHRSVNPVNNGTKSKAVMTKKVSSKSTMTSDFSDDERRIDSSMNRPSQINVRPTASSITFESTRSHIETIPSITELTSKRISTDVLILDDSQSNDSSFNTTVQSKLTNPWKPIPDDVDAVLEQILTRVESAPIDSLVSPTTTDHLPKLRLKSGRFRRGKPINLNNSASPAHEYRPSSMNDQSAENEETTTSNSSTTTINDRNRSARQTYRFNPDGSRVIISRPPLQTDAQSSPPRTLRRKSTDVTPKKM